MNRIEGRMNWEPARADHSIDRATISITLLQPLDANTFDEMVVVGRKSAATRNLIDRLDVAEPFEVADAVQGAVFEFSGLPPRRVLFRRLDVDKMPVEEFSVSAQKIAVGTLRYRRWSDLFGLLTSSLEALDQVYPITQNLKTVRLEYVDRFQSVPGGADHFEVIDRNSPFLAPIVTDKRAALHVHSGWFDFESPDIRQLTNLNIDVHDMPPMGPPDASRKIHILSVGQFEALRGLTLDEPIARLERLHDYLKSTFGRIITSAAAHRVSLTIG